jgi:hypothetical protein
MYEQLRPGRPRPISDERVAQLVRWTLRTKPKAETHWTIPNLLLRRAYRNRRCTASGKRLVYNRIGKDSSSSRTIHFLWKKYGYCRAVFESAGKCSGLVRG